MAGAVALAEHPRLQEFADLLGTPPPTSAPPPPRGVGVKMV